METVHRLWTCPGTLSTTATVTGFEKGRARWGRGLPVPRLLPLVYPRGTGGGAGASLEESHLLRAGPLHVDVLTWTRCESNLDI